MEFGHQKSILFFYSHLKKVTQKRELKIQTHSYREKKYIGKKLIRKKIN